MGSWLSASAQVSGSRPVNGLLPNSTSATPSPSVPGSHEATTPAASGTTPVRSSGRPDTVMTTHGSAAQTLSTAERSAMDSCIVWPLPTSPTPSAYGVSPTTTTPTPYPLIGAEASLL